MKKLISLIAIFISTHSYAQSGTEILLKNKTLESTTEKRTLRKVLDLSDTFLVQAYGRLKSLNIRDKKLQEYFELIFAKDYLGAIKTDALSYTKIDEHRKFIRASRMYLLWRLDLPQSFFNAWVKESVDYNFLETELGVALDQIISPDASQWLISNGIIVTKAQREGLMGINNTDSVFNHSVQAYIRLRQGKKSLAALQRLAPGDPLILPLAKSVLTDFALEGKLAITSTSNSKP